MMRKAVASLAVAVLIPLGASAQPLPPAPVPVTPNPPPAEVAPIPAPTPGPVIPPPPPLPPPLPPPPPPGVGVWTDRNDHVLVGDPLLDCRPGWFSSVDIGILSPHVKNRLYGTVNLGGMNDIVHVPGADLDWTGSTRLELGYRLTQGAGEFLFAWRGMFTDGTGTLAGFDAAGDAFLRSRLTLNALDFDYGNKPAFISPKWDINWRIGLRAAWVSYESEADGIILAQRVENRFGGVGPHGSFEALRRFGDSGLSLFGRVDGAILLGEIDQCFEEFVAAPGGMFFGGMHHSSVQAVPVILLQAGLGFQPAGYDRLRFAFGYQIEYWGMLGQTESSQLNLSAQGAFLRAEFNY